MKSSTKYECVKCKNDPTNGSIYVSGVESYYICKGCDAIIKNHSSHDVIHNFLNNSLDLSDEEKAMIKARQKRNSGKSPWNKQHKDVDNKGQDENRNENVR